jgi:5-methylcytosine-specific restriction enzyme A
MTSEEFTYKISKDVYEGVITKTYGINELAEKINMNRGSASIMIGQVFPMMIEGQSFKRTLSVSYFDCFLRCIHNDYGAEQLTISLSALKKHIDYIAGTGDSKVKLKKVYGKYLDLIPVSQRNEIEQLEIVDTYKNKTKSELKEELINSSKSEDELIVINHITYKRDNKSIALIKILRDFKCQICGHFIIKRDGSKYIEAAHVVSKSERGKEIAENILLLCPNHHKEFDLGNRQIIKHTHELIKFKLNETEHEIKLSID